jgi:hypothetical protein
MEDKDIELAMFKGKVKQGLTEEQWIESIPRILNLMIGDWPISELEEEYCGKICECEEGQCTEKEAVLHYKDKTLDNFLDEADDCLKPECLGKPLWLGYKIYARHQEHGYSSDASFEVISYPKVNKLYMRLGLRTSYGELYYMQDTWKEVKLKLVEAYDYVE